MRLVGILIATTLASTALAQTPPENQRKADALFVEGRKLLTNANGNDADVRAACEKFEQAIALDPTAPGVMLNLGLCYETLEKYATSLYWFRKAQVAAAEAKPAPLPEYENAAKQHTADLAGKVVTAQIDAPVEATVFVDGRRVLPTDYARVEVDKDSVIEARATGKQTFRRTLDVTGRDAGTVQIALVDEELPEIVDPGRGRRRTAYILGASGVAVWGATLTFGLIVRNKYNSGEPGSRWSDFDTAERDLRYIGSGMFVAGTALVGAAVYLYVTAPKPYRERAEQTAIVPVVGRDQLGLAVGGAF